MAELPKQAPKRQRRPRKKTFAEQVLGFLEETGLDVELRQMAADGIRYSINEVRESFRTRPPQLMPEYQYEEPAWQPPRPQHEEDPEDPYVILGVRRDCDWVIVQAAYRARALRAHPDKAGGSVEAFRRINNAYEEIKEDYGQ